MDTTDSIQSIVNILLQFKHMLLFINEHLVMELQTGLKSLSIEFDTNLKLCIKMYNDLLENKDVHQLTEFIKNKELVFGNNRKLFIIDNCGNIAESILMKDFEKSNIKSKRKTSSTTRRTTRLRTKTIENLNSNPITNDTVSNDSTKAKRVKVEAKKTRKVASKPNPKCSSTRKDTKRNTDKTTEKKVSKSSDNEIDILLEASNCIEPIVTLTESSASSNETKDDNTESNQFGIAIKYSCSFGCRYRSFSFEKVKNHEVMFHKEQTFNCLQKDCDNKFSSVYDFEKHNMETHGVFMCTVEKCSKEFENEYKLKKHIKDEHEDEYLTCRICNIKYKKREAFRKHIYVKHESGEFKCDFEKCDFVAEFRRILDNHKSFKHKLKKCTFPDCGRMLCKSAYSQHMKVHQKIKNHICSWPDCGKSFVDTKSLKDHVRVHLNFKRYRCKWPECSYACEQQSNLITHIRVRHFKIPQTKKKQLELNISSESFPNPYDFLETVNEDICML